MALEPFAFQERIKVLEVAGRIAQLSFFFLRRSFFVPRVRGRMRWTGQIFWLLAYDACAARTFFPPSPPKAFGDWPWEVVSSYSSATAPGSHGISRADPLFQADKELSSRTTGLRFSVQDLFICRANFRRAHIRFSSQSHRHWRRRFHRLKSCSRVAGKISKGAPDRDR